MVLTRKHIDRRTFLRGAGVTLSLPLLESMVPAFRPARAAEAGKTRFLTIFSPHGWSPTYWADGRPDVPPTEGRNVGLGLIHKPLEPWKDKLTIVSGVDATSSMPPPGSSGGDHSRASATFTGVAPKKTAGADINSGTSVDQIVAQKFGQETLLPSIQLAIEDPGANTGICGWGYSCAYSNSISWAAPTKPLPHEINPMVVFEHLFGDGSTAEERVARRQATGSILDAVTAKITRLQKVLPPADRARLGEYLESIREMERRLQIAAKRSAEAPALDVPFGVPDSFDEHIKLHFDLTALAFQGDITRVASLMFARDVSLRSYPESGITTANHPASHHGEDPKRREEWAKINQYHMRCFARFLKKLQDTPDGDSNLFERTLIVWGSNMGNANQHSHVNVGYLMAGGASGRHKGKLNVNTKGPTANVLLTSLRLMGIERDSIGDSTGTIAI
ncbi:MAG: DUF1552 domain-containing protein [Acidobacteriia bacterium]|nr:DUF1552 domain-containing protein [Terriglobia bacterium]